MGIGTNQTIDTVLCSRSSSLWQTLELHIPQQTYMKQHLGSQASAQGRPSQSRMNSLIRSSWQGFAFPYSLVPLRHYPRRCARHPAAYPHPTTLHTETLRSDRTATASCSYSSTTSFTCHAWHDSHMHVRSPGFCGHANSGLRWQGPHSRFLQLHAVAQGREHASLDTSSSGAAAVPSRGTVQLDPIDRPVSYARKKETERVLENALGHRQPLHEALEEAASVRPQLNALQEAAAFSDISKPLLIIAGE